MWRVTTKVIAEGNSKRAAGKAAASAMLRRVGAQDQLGTRLRSADDELKKYSLLPHRRRFLSL